jgi:hypothetical protein
VKVITSSLWGGWRNAVEPVGVMQLQLVSEFYFKLVTPNSSTLTFLRLSLGALASPQGGGRGISILI